jgi:hypothetical protein
VYAARSFPAVSEEAGMHKRFVAEQLDIACDDDNQYVCGSQLFPVGHKLNEAVYCNHSLTCRKNYIEANATESEKGMASNLLITIKYTKMMLCVCCA